MKKEDKSPKRIQLFKEIAQDIQLPPRPTIVRWGTWLSAAIYYSKNFELIRYVLRQLDDNGFSAISRSKDLIQLENSRNELLYITSNYSLLPDLLLKLESVNLHIYESISIYETEQKKLSLP